MAIASLGDVDKDGYSDFAVGAPYDGEDGRGVVYIYLGSIDGVVKTASQTIAANTIAPGLETFGFSLSGGLDLDFNEYPDLLIGSYKSDSVAYLRARPVVNVSGGFFFEKPMKGIDLSNKSCQLKDGTQVSCLPYRLCLHYGGEGVNNQISLEVEYMLDSKKNAPRMFFINYEGRNKFRRTFTLIKGATDCDTGHAYIKDGIRDKLTPIVGTATFKLSELTPFMRGLRPIVGPVHSFEDAITIQRNCGGDDVCIPDLQLSAVLNRESYLVGSGDNIEMDVKVFNGGEDSFETTAFLTMPSGVNYVKIERLDTNHGIPVFCSPNLSQRIVKCDIGNPLPAYQQVRFNIIVHPQAIQGDRENLLKALEFMLTVNSTNPDDESFAADNMRKISVPLRVEAELLVSGVQEPETVTYNRSNYKKDSWKSEKEVGPQVVHRYIVENRGPSDINEAVAFIVWPTYASNGDYLLYLMEQPEVEGPGWCRKVKNVNPLNLELFKEKIQGNTEFLQEELDPTSTGSGVGSGEGLLPSSSDEHLLETEYYSGSSVKGNAGYGQGTSTSTDDSESSSNQHHFRHGSQQQHGGNEGHYDANAGVGNNHESTFHRSSSSSNIGTSDSGERVKTSSYYEEKVYRSSSSKTSSASKTSSSLSGGSKYHQAGSSHDDFYGASDDMWDPNGNALPRTKRQAPWMKDFRREAKDCGPTTSNCTIINCTIGPLGQADKFIVTLRARLWIHTLADLGYGDASISSKMVARVTSLPHGVDPSYMRFQATAVKSIINPGDEIFEAKPVPWWVYLLAALGGLLLLLLLIYGLYKCGFFKRKRPKHANGSGPGRMPLNGYDHNDTAL
ncbi:unnamed protein product [Notodromas monacha]|uniref:Integrin alpha-2 domain-containing protein n=1 Tax=Notodromas monacha TaxID=399045 RepID=A0A7R9BM96_9CRUS|nr:unnamed protein product [Notodromas monacha]CAG0916768.1 unnamed protein product [Notodromas monacha]